MLSALFGARSFLDPDIEAWHLDVWAMLIERYGDTVAIADTPLVLPTRQYFPPTEAIGHAKAEHIFECVKGIMGLSDWPCSLEPQGRRRSGQQVSEFVHLGGDETPNGTFRIEAGGDVVISYAPELLDDPTGLVATFAHELAHYLLASEADLVEDETHELMTDLTVAFVGFGLFGANSCFSFEQHGDAFGQGWRSRSSGYLSPRSWAFALAVFGELRGDEGEVAHYLKPEIEGLRRQAVKYLRKNPSLLQGLRASA
ncbi:MAG: hypothetical protein JHC81_00870 [Brevundimonas sp.]|jgi:hypothetical protein|uniref:hypothetical protein n=1 Tax=Brevundimonas sp. TaxID=1871086 RepID=UPI001A2C40CE|nr:hypothetical protein [Brevundimonas sp.]MBJ7446057.1 hypothetical protein [Brevundimonas sp.]